MKIAKQNARVRTARRKICCSFISRLLGKNQRAADRHALSKLYGVPDGAPAICQAKASGEDAVKSMAGSTVEYDCTKSLYTALPLNCAKTSTPLGGHATIPASVPLAAMEFGPSTAAPEGKGGALGGVGTGCVTLVCLGRGDVLPSFTISDVPQ